MWSHKCRCDPGRLAYFGMRADAKARVQMNLFCRWYQCKFLREQCMSQNATATSNKNLWYFDFRPTCPRYMTYISNQTYLDTADPVSPWTSMPGWSLRSVFWDWMHCCYLGIGGDVVSNLLGDMEDLGLLGGDTLENNLRAFSIEMNKEF